MSHLLQLDPALNFVARKMIPKASQAMMSNRSLSQSLVIMGYVRISTPLYAPWSAALALPVTHATPMMSSAIALSNDCAFFLARHLLSKCTVLMSSYIATFRSSLTTRGSLSRCASTLNHRICSRDSLRMMDLISWRRSALCPACMYIEGCLYSP